MHHPALSFRALAWLIRDTFRHAWASGVFVLILIVSIVCGAVCLTVRLVPGDQTGAPGPGVPPPLSSRQLADASGALGNITGSLAMASQGRWVVPAGLVSRWLRQAQLDEEQKARAPRIWTRVEILRGAMVFDLAGDFGQAVRTLQLHLATWVAETAGLLLVLLWTAGFLPAFLEAHSVSVLLAKPVPRWSLLVGRTIGVLCFVAFQASLFLLLTWAALGVRTGVWDGRYWISLPLLLLHFSVFFSFSAMLAVATRNTAACVLGSAAFWILCWTMNFGRHVILSLPDLAHLRGLRALEVGYLVLPKPLDFHFLLLENFNVENLFGDLIRLQDLVQKGDWQPETSLVSSVLAGGVLFLIAVYDFWTMDY
jgi:hypothetical protein